MTRSFPLPDERATEALAASLAAALPDDSSGWSILLQGELGSGKTTLARALLGTLGHEAAVPSPTYTLVEPYDIGGRIIYHVDLYRISDPDELQYLGWSDWQDGLLLVEWPERAGRLLDTADLSIRLGYAEPGRTASIAAHTARGRALLQNLRPVYDRP